MHIHKDGTREPRTVREVRRGTTEKSEEQNDRK